MKEKGEMKGPKKDERRREEEEEEEKEEEREKINKNQGSTKYRGAQSAQSVR